MKEVKGRKKSMELDPEYKGRRFVNFTKSVSGPS